MKIHFQSGQTILEMLIVFFIISVGLYGAVTLIFSNLNMQEQDEDRIVAMNLAREELEIAQNIRDSNWMAGALFNSGLGTDTGADCTAVPDWNGTGFPAFDFTADNILDGVINISTNPASIGMLTNNNGTPTSYWRLITFAPICANPADHLDIQVPAACTCTDPAYSAEIGIRAKADVMWDRKGKRNSLSIYSDLYDWR